MIKRNISGYLMTAGESDPSDAVMLAAQPAKPATVTVSGVVTLTNIIVIPLP